MYRSLQSVTEDSQSRGCGHIYPDYTASTITNCHEKKANNPLSARCSSVSCAGISVQICNNHCLLSPFALSTFPTITQRLCCSGSATGIVFGMHVTDPILNFVRNRCMYYDAILLLLLQEAAAAAASSQCDLHCQPGGQQQY